MLKQKTFKAALVLFALAIACLGAYQFNGSYVDNEGFLHETFGFIPLAWLSMFGAVLLVAVSYWRTRKAT
ncbi:DUF3955 domain-containing protein [Pseudoalteromonas fenneropenaei]|uniref:DUF3955 domain-containing protein n=1 Tax=Pseudoalteromonas fenneropenaei TaxID=1737459 RepID=A0ABV7CID4_9GAMM